MTANADKELIAHLSELENRLEAESRRRARAETKLRRLEKALETMQLGVTITDVEGRIVYTNPSDAQMHGYEVGEVIGCDISIYSCPDDRRPLTPDELRSIGSWERESFNRRKDGSVFPVQLLSDVVIDSRGNPIGTVTTCQDITGRKATELAVRGELVAANRVLQDEMADMARRIRDALERP